MTGVTRGYNVLISFKNIFKGNVDEVYFGKKKRENVDFVIPVVAIGMICIKLNSDEKNVDDKDAFAVVINTSAELADPKAFFINEGDARRFYNDLANALLSEQKHAEFDVLEYNAI